MKFSRRILPIAPSATMAVTGRAAELKAEGVDVISFGAGEPDFATPKFIVDAMVDAAREGATGYAPVAGLPALRDAVAREFTEIYGVPFDRNHIIVTCGGKQALFNLFQVLLDPKDQVLIPSPYWVSYPAQVELAEGEPVFVQCRPDQGFKLDMTAVREAISDRTVGIILNSPNNPTGGVQDAETLRELADVAEEHDLWICTDDIYSYLRYDGGEFVSVLRERPDLRDRIIIVHGASKTFAMTGWRLGFMGAHPSLIKKMGIIQGQSTSGATTFAQHGAVAAISSDKGFLKEWLAAYDARRKRIVSLLNDIEGVSCALPGGAFYVFPDVNGLLGRKYKGRVIDSDLELAQTLLEHAHVAFVPGEPFGAPGFMRLSYACSMESIEEGLARFAKFVSEMD